MSAVDVDAGVVVIPKRISLGIAAAIAVQLVGSVYWFATSQATANGRIEQLERDTRRDAGTIVAIDARTVQMQVDVAYIRATVDGLKKR